MNDWAGERLKDLRQKAGYTQEEAARQLGVSVYTWVNWERGHKPNDERMRKLAAFFKCDIGWLAYGVRSK